MGLQVLPTWFAYSPVKNNIVDATKKFTLGIPPHGATSGEMDYYKCSYDLLKMVGVKADKPDATKLEVRGMSFDAQPLIAFSPFFAVSYKELAERVMGAKVKMTKNSTLVIKGRSSLREH